MGSKKMKKIVLITALCCVMSVGGIMAYFTDADTVTNEFTVGKISLDLQEPEWNPVNGKDMTPKKTVQKNPQILNDGVNDEFVFLEVLVPYANVVTANEDGTKNAASDTEIFSYTVNEGWTELKEERKITENTVRYLYVWGTEGECKVLSKEITTGTLFDKVTMANIVENQGLEETNPEIVLNAYGIQTTDLDGNKINPSEVWKILKKQAPTTDIEEVEDSNTDIKEKKQPTDEGADDTKTEEKQPDDAAEKAAQ